MAVAQESRRLYADDWSAAALTLLADQGIDGVRIELLARKLGVTKGSFYWHFKDRDALLVAMLERWRRRATLNLIERINRNEDPRQRLLKLLRIPFAGSKAEQAADVELAVRLWGRRDARARAALAEVDQLRIEYIANLIANCGVPAADARARAVLAYAYMRVAATLIPPDDDALTERCEAVLVGPLLGTAE